MRAHRASFRPHPGRRFEIAREREIDGAVVRLEGEGAADGAEVEFAPEPLNDGPVRHMMCRIPGGLRVEFIAP